MDHGSVLKEGSGKTGISLEEHTVFLTRRTNLIGPDGAVTWDDYMMVLRIEIAVYLKNKSPNELLAGVTRETDRERYFRGHFGSTFGLC